MYRPGDLVITRQGVGEIEAIMRQRDRYGRWVWGLFRWSAGPYLVRLTRGTLVACGEDDLCYHRITAQLGDDGMDVEGGW